MKSVRDIADTVAAMANREITDSDAVALFNRVGVFLEAEGLKKRYSRLTLLRHWVSHFEVSEYELIYTWLSEIAALLRSMLDGSHPDRLGSETFDAIAGIFDVPGIRDDLRRVLVEAATKGQVEINLSIVDDDQKWFELLACLLHAISERALGFDPAAPGKAAKAFIAANHLAFPNLPHAHVTSLAVFVDQGAFKVKIHTAGRVVWVTRINATKLPVKTQINAHPVRHPSSYKIVDVYWG